LAAAAVWLDCCRIVPDFLAAAGATRGAGSRALPAGMGEARPALQDRCDAHLRHRARHGGA
jgi:hypothetical protein